MKPAPFEYHAPSRTKEAVGLLADLGDSAKVTPGFITSVTAFLRDNPSPTDEEIREGLSGNLCRCTGYQGILAAVRAAADNMNKATTNAGTSNAASINEEAR